MFGGFHMGLPSAIIALAAGVALLYYVKAQDKVKKGWGEFVAWIVIILAIISIICSGYYIIRLRSSGYFEKHHQMMEKMYQKEMQKDQMYDDGQY